MTAARAFVALTIAALPAFAQLTTPNTSFDAVPAHTLRVEAEGSWVTIARYRTNGMVLELPARLDFLTTVVRVAYAPTRRIAFGAELPYRIVQYQSQRDRGMPGVGVFGDLSHEMFRSPAVLRIGYLRAFRAADPEFSANADVDRYFIAYGVERPFGERLAGYARIEGYYAPPAKADDTRGTAGWLHIAVGQRLSERSEIRLLTRLGATTAWQDEGSLRTHKPARSADLGLTLQWQMRPEFRIRASLTRTVVATDGPQATRLSFSAVQTFGRQ